MASRYTPAQEEELKKTILNRMNEISQEIDQCSFDLENPHDTSDEVDVATSSTERMMLIQRREKLRELKAGLEANLGRIANGTIGICSITKETIPFERMLLVPHATKGIVGKGLDRNRAQAQKLSVFKEINLSHANATNEIGVFAGDEEEITDFEQDTLPVTNTPPKFASQGMKTKRR